MSNYRFRLIEDEVVREIEFEHKDDIEAFKTAEVLALHFDVELSHGHQFLALIRRGGHTVAAGPDAIGAVPRSLDARPSELN